MTLCDGVMNGTLPVARRCDCYMRGLSGSRGLYCHNRLIIYNLSCNLPSRKSGRVKIRYARRVLSVVYVALVPARDHQTLESKLLPPPSEVDGLAPFH